MTDPSERMEPREVPGQELSAWFATPPGEYLLEWEQAHFDAAVVDAFGYHALQLGLPQLDALAVNRMPHRWLALPEASEAGGESEPLDGSVDPEPRRAALVTHAAALPFGAQSLDLVVLPHTLELSADPHAVLREVERVLVPNGRVLISGLNPMSLWGVRQARAHALSYLGLGQTRMASLYLPAAGEFIGHWRLRDWLRLLNLEVQSVQLGCYRPAVRSARWLQRWRWIDPWGERWWPILGAVYFIEAIKRVRGLHLLGPAWRPTPAGKAAAIARRDALASDSSSSSAP